jgi:hypothetical protein
LKHCNVDHAGVAGLVDAEDAAHADACRTAAG